MAKRRSAWKGCGFGGCGCGLLGFAAIAMLATCGRQPVTPEAPAPSATQIAPAAPGEGAAAKKARARYWVNRNRAERQKRAAEAREQKRQAAAEAREVRRLEAEQRKADTEGGFVDVEQHGGVTSAPTVQPMQPSYSPPSYQQPYAEAPTGVNPETQQVRGYIRKDGRYVAPYVRTKPNDTTLDNFGRR